MLSKMGVDQIWMKLLSFWLYLWFSIHYRYYYLRTGQELYLQGIEEWPQRMLSGWVIEGINRTEPYVRLVNYHKATRWFWRFDIPSLGVFEAQPCWLVCMMTDLSSMANSRSCGFACWLDISIVCFPHYHALHPFFWLPLSMNTSQVPPGQRLVCH